MARKLVSLAQYEMQAAANKGGAKEMYNNSGWSVGNNAARSTGQRAAAGSSGKRTGGASAGTAQSAGGTAQSQLLELYSAQQAALRAARRAAYESTVADQQRQYQQNLSRVNAAGSMHIVLLCWVLYLAIHAAVLYIPTRLLLKKKLNLP